MPSPTSTSTRPLLIAVIVALAPAAASAFDGAAYKPSSLHLQTGNSTDATSFGVGASWDWSWQRQLRLGLVGGAWEATIGRWRARHTFPGASDHTTHLMVVPTLRLRPAAAPAWFIDVGVGVALVNPVFRTRDKQFSTVFNFAEHLAVGRCFGAGCAHELSLRGQHVSNANIKDPNPGETQVQIRYSLRL